MCCSNLKLKEKVIKAKAKDTVVLEKESPTYYSKFKRYARSKNSIHAHVPSNIEVKEFYQSIKYDKQDSLVYGKRLIPDN